MSQPEKNKREREPDNAGPTRPARPASMSDTAPEIPQTPAPGPNEAMDVPVNDDDDGDVSDLEDSQMRDLNDLPNAPPQTTAPPGPGPGVQTRGKKAAGGVPDGNDAASSVSGASTATNLSNVSQASIASIASSVDQLPLPDAELMLFEVAEGVHRLTDAGMNLFNMVAERAGGYGPIASIAFISLLSANPNLLPTIKLTGIASQIGLTADAAAAAAAAAAPATTGIFSSLTGAATSAAASIGHGITAGVTAIAAVVGTNEIIDNPLTIDHIASMIESAGRKAIGAAITVAQFQNRISTSFKKLKANWTVQNLSVEGISIRQDENIRALVERAVEAHGQVLAPADNDVPRLNVTELRTMYNDIIREINNVAPTEPANQLNPADQLIVNAVENGAAAAPAPPAAGADRNTGGGKKNRKSQKKPRKKVTRSKRGKKAARKTKKQSRRKSRGKKHGKKH